MAPVKGLQNDTKGPIDLASINTVASPSPQYKTRGDIHTWTHPTVQDKEEVEKTSSIKTHLLTIYGISEVSSDLTSCVHLYSLAAVLTSHSDGTVR